MSDHENEGEKREHLRKIINAAQNGIFVTRGAQGLHGRPMANAEVAEAFSAIWFATSRTSVKVEEIQRDPHVLLAYQKGAVEWATVNGRARMVQDRAKIRELWSPFWKSWFSGPDDPDLVLLEVIPDAGEYWDSGNKLIAMVKFAVGAMTGKGVLQEDNQKVTL